MQLTEKRETCQTFTASPLHVRRVGLKRLQAASDGNEKALIGV